MAFIMVCACALELASPFADGMVLQRGRPVPVWGSALPGEVVTVSFAGNKASAAAGSDGRWKATLPPMQEFQQAQQKFADDEPNAAMSVINDLGNLTGGRSRCGCRATSRCAASP